MLYQDLQSAPELQVQGLYVDEPDDSEVSAADSVAEVRTSE